MVERVLHRGEAMAHGHLERRTLRDAAARLLDEAPGLFVHVRRMDEQIAVAKEPGAAEPQERLGLHADMQDRRNARLARRAER